jgi:hypothetical protein
LAISATETGNLTGLWRFSISAACIFPSCALLIRSVKSRKSHHIDISGIGQIRLAEHNELAAAILDNAQHSANTGKVFRLTADSTIWPWLLLLRLRSDDQHIKILLILPDCVGAHSFRALSVACRWIATHNNSCDHKIL